MNDTIKLKPSASTKDSHSVDLTISLDDDVIEAISDLAEALDQGND